MVYFVATICLGKSADSTYSEYLEKVVPIVEKYNGRYIIRSEKITPLGEDWKPDKVVIIEFDTKEHLEECFASEEYKRIAPLRENAVIGNAIMVE